MPLTNSLTKYGRPSSVVPPSAAQRLVAEQAALKRYLLSRSGNQNPALAAWHQAVAEFAKIFGTSAAQTVREPTSLRETFVHLRGDFRRSGEKEELAPLAAIGKNTIADRRLTRLDLANWIVAPAKPLTARVAANDIWQRLFGVGLVDTPGDFGRQGDPPSHPELLDWLASQYLRCGWSRKAMIRKIVCSATYRQSSRARAELADRDPKNQLLARQNYQCTGDRRLPRSGRCSLAKTSRRAERTRHHRRRAGKKVTSVQHAHLLLGTARSALSPSNLIVLVCHPYTGICTHSSDEKECV